MAVFWALSFGIHSRVSWHLIALSVTLYDVLLGFHYKSLEVRMVRVGFESTSRRCCMAPVAVKRFVELGG